MIFYRFQLVLLQLRAVFLIALADILLRVIGTEHTLGVLKLLRRLPTKAWPCETIVETVQNAKRIYPFRGDCLREALVQWVLLREDTATVVLGFVSRPFYAHAWVEVDGIPIDGSELIEQCARLVAFFD